jgi:hypothetical protein
MKKTHYKRLKASSLTIPKHKYAVRYRIVILEVEFNGIIDYATAMECIEEPDEYWFCYVEGSKEIPLERFKERMKEQNVVEDTAFTPEELYSEWK